MKQNEDTIIARLCVGVAAIAGCGFMPAYVAAEGYSHEWEENARMAQTGDADAQYSLACMYLAGDEVDLNPEEAAYWLRKSASNGNAEAMLALGKLFQEGRGVLADNRIAAENYWRAAEHGNAEGAYRYAEMLRDGKGVPANKAKAYYWFKKAADAGYSEASSQADLLKKYASHPAKKSHKKSRQR